MEYVINFDEQEAYERALKVFIKNCGFKPDSEKHKRMLATAMEIRESGVEKIDIKALVSEYGPGVIRDDYIEIDGVKLQCDSVYQMDKSKIHKMLLYIITVDECGCGSEDILDRVYADFWGTAYVDAAFELFRREIEARYTDSANPKLELSEAFGPGYYGMPTEEIKTFFQIIDPGKIGVKCHPSCVMLPIKSCAGIIFIIEKGAKMPEKSCESCLGNKSGCRYCKFSK